MAERYQALSASERASFDTERLRNPYRDVRIVVGDRDTEFGAIVTGIQIEEPELLLAAYLRHQYPMPSLLITHLPSRQERLWERTPVRSPRAPTTVSSPETKRAVWVQISTDNIL